MMDAKDWILLKALQEDARLPWAELGRRAELSAPAAAERVRRLEDAGIIRGYRAEVDPAALGWALPVMIEVQVKRADYSRFHKAVQGLPQVLECHHVTGRAAFAVRAAVESVEGLEALIGKLSAFGETATSLILSTPVRRRVFVASAGGRTSVA